MKWLITAMLAMLVCLAAIPAIAQSPSNLNIAPPPCTTPDPSSQFVTSGTLQPTPDMWYYQQNLKLYTDPYMNAHNAAKLRAEQRNARIASRKWYGYSLSRPNSFAGPSWGTYMAPMFAGGVHNPNLWIGPAVVPAPQTTIIAPQPAVVTGAPQTAIIGSRGEAKPYNY